MAEEAKKRSTKIMEVAKKGRQKFEASKKRSTKYFSKADTINLVQFLVLRVRRNHAQTSRSNAPSAAHQRGRVSGVVDGNFPYW